MSAALPDGVLAAIRNGMGGLRCATGNDVVGNDECAYSFDSPWGAGGLFVSLKTFRGCGPEFVVADAAKQKCALYAHHAWRKVPRAKPADADQAPPSALGVGVAGGFETEADKYDVVKQRCLAVVMDGAVVQVALSHDVPEFVVAVAQSLLDHAGSRDVSAERAWALTDEPMVNSKYAAALPQCVGAVGRGDAVISFSESDARSRTPAADGTATLSPDPKQWRCALAGDTDNLWLNLSTGYIGGGRDQSAWGGPKGSNGAKLHFEATGSLYPLVVKLGTINGATGTAEVYSYAPDEDGPVLDPKLAEHLAFWGINALRMEKTEKTTAELEVDANAKFEWSAIAEEGRALVARSGPGLVGLANLGNSCYVNSVLQLLSAIPEVGRRYHGAETGDAARAIVLSVHDEPQGDVLLQCAKVVSALRGGKYVLPAAALVGRAAADSDDGLYETAGDATQAAAATLAPRAFRSLLGRGHAEFSTPRQQDAAEYLAHVLEALRRAEHAALESGRLEAAAVAADAAGAEGAYGANDVLRKQPLAQLFTFGLEERTECCQSQMVRYSEAPQLMLEVPLPRQLILDEKRSADGESEQKRTRLDDQKRRSVSLDACLQQWTGDEQIDEFFSSATNSRGKATRRQRLATSPRYLLLKLNRYYVSSSWEAKKMDVDVEMPLKLDISALKAPPKPNGEALLPEEFTPPVGAPAAAAQAAAVVPDELVVSQLLSMGFDENGCRRACVATRNAGAEQAMEWVFQHMGDADFTDPLDTNATTGPAGTEPDAAKITELFSLGFSARQAEGALKACDQSTERAADWIFSHMDNLDAAVDAVLLSGTAPAAAASVAQDLEDGGCQYELAGIVSHIGKNTGCGHYVAHVRQADGSFVIFNDEKVATSENPPLNLGYVYLYKRL